MIHTKAARLRHGALLLAAGLCLGLAACESGPRALTPEERSAATPMRHDDYATLGYRVEWRGFPTLSPGARLDRMEVLGDAIVAQDSAGVVTVLETRSGERRWTDPVDTPLTKFVGLNRDGNRILVSSESNLFLYDADTGAVQGKQRFAQVVNTRPVQVGEVLVYGTLTGQVLGHLILNGFRQWGSFTSAAIETDPVLLGQTGLVGIIDRAGEIVILDGLSGSARGRTKIYGGTSAPLAASDSVVYVASRDHSLYAIRDDASQLWRIRTEAPLQHAPAFHDGRVYCDMGADGLCAFDANTGERIWSSKDVHGAVIAMRNGRLLVWDGRTASTVDPARGALVDSVELPDTTMIRTDQFVDGQLYLVSRTGVVTRLTPRT